jgi:ribosomal protein L14
MSVMVPVLFEYAVVVVSRTRPAKKDGVQCRFDSNAPNLSLVAKKSEKTQVVRRKAACGKRLWDAA